MQHTPSYYYASVTVEENASCSRDVFRMKLHCSDISSHAEPGQFVMVRAAEKQSDDPLLPRPFSVHWSEQGRFEILYKVVGRGTRAMAGLKPGEEIAAYGPLGKGFTINRSSTGEHLLIAGGIGVAPLLFLAGKLKEALPEARLNVVMGARCAEEIVEARRFEELGADSISFVTEDGSLGSKGMVTDLLKGYGPIEPGAMVYSCGPMPMLKAVSRWCKEKRLSCQISTETIMACGIGACLGCAIKSSDNDDDKYLHVCTDGPVFDSTAFDWA